MDINCGNNSKAYIVRTLWRHYTKNHKSLEDSLNVICKLTYIKRFQDVEINTDFSNFPIINSKNFDEIHGKGSMMKALY